MQHSALLLCTAQSAYTAWADWPADWPHAVQLAGLEAIPGETYCKQSSFLPSIVVPKGISREEEEKLVLSMPPVTESEPLPVYPSEHFGIHLRIGPAIWGGRLAATAAAQQACSMMLSCRPHACLPDTAWLQVNGTLEAQCQHCLGVARLAASVKAARRRLGLPDPRGTSTSA